MTAHTAPPRRWQRIALIGVLVLVLIHSFLIALWLSPDNAIRTAVGGDRLTSYVNPYFQQSWDDLEPRLERVDETLELRAVLIHPDTGEEVTTAWIDLIGRDLDRSGGWWNRDRASVITRLLAVNLNQMIVNLEPEHREILAEDSDEDALRRLRGDLERAGADPRDAANYVITERMASVFASLYADAFWAGRIQSIQLRPGMRTVPEDRRVAASDREFGTWDLGWRPVAPFSPDARRSFAPYLDGRR